MQTFRRQKPDYSLVKPCLFKATLTLSKVTLGGESCTHDLTPGSPCLQVQQQQQTLQSTYSQWTATTHLMEPAPSTHIKHVRGIKRLHSQGLVQRTDANENQKKNFSGGMQTIDHRSALDLISRKWQRIGTQVAMRRAREVESLDECMFD